ncbi:unnamed protein product [Spirodela intermedia]|uniref:Uncharacterized protein n=1 Tax=Spirodela intermedia TaxID=51605 RepID=A0A7I8JJE6_SPIIN|nr:unnamed protein product [Spirodela intermedia]CAA6670190.1 unnamed protein product [Spirodela intermedia]
MWRIQMFFFGENPGVSGITEAQAALMDYLHYTRSFQFTDAEYISMNSPIFLSNLLKKVKDRQDIGRSITRFLLFHPINEFEPFFESLGLVPSEFNQYLPRDLMFLSDDSVLLQNYHTLVNYGVPRTKIGKIFKEAMGILFSEDGILSSKLRSYEEIGLSRTSIIKIISSAPSLLIGDVDRDFVRVLEELESMGVDREWIGRNLSEENSYLWGRMLMLLQFFRQLGFSRREVGALVRRNPGFLLDNSGKMVFSVVGLLAKMGSTKDELSGLFLHFPSIQLESFVNNLRFSLLFLTTIGMEPEDIKEVTPCSVLTSLSVGHKRLCRIIKQDPHQFKNWVFGMKIDRLPNCKQDHISLEQKEKFLLGLGFSENSKEMKRALSKFRGKGDELQERYNCFVDAGLDPKDVSKMIKLAPHILNQSKDVLEMKMDFLVNGLGYPLDSLVTFPSFMSFTLEGSKPGKVKPNMALSTILATAEKVFLKRFVERHSEGPKVWEKFKRTVDHC